MEHKAVSLFCNNLSLSQIKKLYVLNISFICNKEMSVFSKNFSSNPHLNELVKICFCVNSISVTRFYFDSVNSSCQKFEFTGDGGNENNFPTELDCLNDCYIGKCFFFFGLHI